jgi:hypothetical protein
MQTGGETHATYTTPPQAAPTAVMLSPASFASAEPPWWIKPGIHHRATEGTERRGRVQMKV